MVDSDNMKLSFTFCSYIILNYIIIKNIFNICKIIVQTMKIG